MTSLPDYDPNNPGQALDKDRLNRMSAGLFEMGSTFKAFTTAMALDSGKVKITDSFDATRPIRIGGFTISDFHGKRRVLTVPEVFIYSSNIGSAKEAEVVGIEGHQEFLTRMGLLSRMTDRTAGSRHADPAEGVEADQLDDDLLRPRRVDDAAADRRRRRRADERRQADPADLPAAQPRRGRCGRDAGHQREDQRRDALSLPAERRRPARLGQRGRGHRLPRRRQDRHGRKGGQRPLFRHQAVQRLPVRLPDGRSRATSSSSSSTNPSRRRASTTPPPA